MLFVLFIFSTQQLIYSQENSGILCSDGIDNDGDGLIDCDDQECTTLMNNGCQTCFGDGLSFADVVIEYSQPCPTNVLTNASKALGVSDHVEDQQTGNLVSLGEGGFIKLGFTNNLVVNSGNNDPDIWVFEVGSRVEAMTIELRPFDQNTIDLIAGAGVTDTDGDGFFDFGGVAGATASIDIDAFASGFLGGDLIFDAIKLTDVPDLNCMGPTPGADLDAVCALSSLPVEVCGNDVDEDGDGLIDCDDPDVQMECCCLVNTSLELGENIETCIGDTIHLIVSEPFNSFIWSTGEIGNEIQVTSSGNYRVTVTEENNCELIDEINVQFNPDPVRSSTLLKCPNEAISVFGEMVSEPGIYFDTMLQVGQPCDTILQIIVVDHQVSNDFLGADQDICGRVFNLQSPWPNTRWPDQTHSSSFNVSQSGVVVASAVDSNACTVIDSVAIRLINIGEIYVPNAFSPNNDGINDDFRPFAESIDELEYTMTIFDRWGNQLFERSGRNVVWDGTTNEKPLAAGTYVYQITVLDSVCDLGETYNGDILLIR